MVKIRAKKDCRFKHGGAMFRFKEGEEAEVDVPIERIDTRSFEILGKEEKEQKQKIKTKIINHGGD